MNKRFRLLVADIAFAAVLISCAALSVLALSYQADAETRYQSKTQLSIAERDAAYISRESGQLLQDIGRALETTSGELMRSGAAPTDIFQHLLKNIHHLNSISLLDAQGKVIASSSPENIGHVLDPATCPDAPFPGGRLRIGPTYSGHDLSDGSPVDVAKPTPGQGFIPIIYTRLGNGEEKSLVATLKLEYLLQRIAGLSDTPDTRIALLRSDGMRLLDTGGPANAGLRMIERSIVDHWQNGVQHGAEEQEAIDARRWLTAHRRHPDLPVGVVWAADRDVLLKSIKPEIFRNSMTIALLTIAGMVCVLFAYLFFRYATRHERTRLSKTEAQWRLLENSLNACASAIIITRPDGIIEWINPAFTTLTGYAAAEAIGCRPGELTKSGKHSKTFYTQMWQTILDGRVWHGEIINRRKDGSLYDELLTIAPAFDSKGVIQHFIATKEDFTQNKVARQELEIAHSHLNSVVENFPGSLIMEDLEGRIILLNQNVFELLGLPGSEEYVLGKPVQPLMVFTSHIAEDSQAFLDRIKELRAAARPVYREEIPFKDGRWVERDFVPIRLYEDPIGFLYIYNDISRQKRHARELWQLATSDPLTGIPNRRAFFENIDRERARLTRYPGEAAILMVDVDHFKQINDTHGHAAGDAMLCHIVKQMRKLLRESDILARLGGEEFAILSPQANREGALGLGERVRKVLEDNPLVYEDVLIGVTASVGVAIMTADDPNTDKTLSRADHALYEAKRKGRNRVEFA
jgi:diguanylate cyclase (GGDEF)-like protein/PAS domain S-box-containing protein